MRAPTLVQTDFSPPPPPPLLLPPLGRSRKICSEKDDIYFALLRENSIVVLLTEILPV